MADVLSMAQVIDTDHGAEDITGLVPVLSDSPFAITTLQVGMLESVTEPFTAD